MFSPQDLHAVHGEHLLRWPPPPQLRPEHHHHDQRHRGHDHLPGRPVQVSLLQGELLLLLIFTRLSCCSRR